MVGGIAVAVSDVAEDNVASPAIKKIIIILAIERNS